MADLLELLDIICSDEPPEPTIEVSLVAADIDMHRQDRAQTQLRPAVNKRPERRVARYPGPKKRSKVEHSAVAACMREAKANSMQQIKFNLCMHWCSQHANVAVVSMYVKPRWRGGSRRAGVKTLQLPIKGSEKTFSVHILAEAAPCLFVEFWHTRNSERTTV